MGRFNTDAWDILSNSKTFSVIAVFPLAYLQNTLIVILIRNIGDWTGMFSWYHHRFIKGKKNYLSALPPLPGIMQLKQGFWTTIVWNRRQDWDGQGEDFLPLPVAAFEVYTLGVPSHVLSPFHFFQACKSRGVKMLFHHDLVQDSGNSEKWGCNSASWQHLCVCAAPATIRSSHQVWRASEMEVLNFSLLILPFLPSTVSPSGWFSSPGIQIIVSPWPAAPQGPDGSFPSLFKTCCWVFAPAAFTACGPLLANSPFTIFHEWQHNQHRELILLI